MYPAVATMVTLAFLVQATAFVPAPTALRASVNDRKVGGMMRKQQQQQSRYHPCLEAAPPLSMHGCRTACMAVAPAAASDGGVDGGALPNVLCHGEILFDCIAKPEAAGWDLSRVVESEMWTPYPGGAPANVACALSKLGIPANFVGAVGRDDQGDELLQVLESSGVGTELAVEVDDFPTRTVMVTRDVDGDRTFAGFGDGKASDSFADCHHRLSEMKSSAMALLRPGSWVVQGTLGLAYPGSMESHVCLAEWAKEAGAVRFLDINWRPVFWELAASETPMHYEVLARERITAFSLTADVVKLTDEEAEWLCGVSGDEALRDPSCLASFFPEAKAILVTGGAKGAGYSMGGNTGFVPSFDAVDIVETTGAGDAFSAGFISRAIKRLSLDAAAAGGGSWGVGAGEAREMVRFASAVGALTCGGDGAIVPQPREGDALRLLAGAGGE